MSVAIVAISELTRRRVTTRPFKTPTAPPKRMPAVAPITKLPDWFVTSIATHPAKASDAPTERSTSPATSSMVMPTATMRTRADCRRIATMFSAVRNVSVVSERPTQSSARMRMSAPCSCPARAGRGLLAREAAVSVIGSCPIGCCAGGREVPPARFALRPDKKARPQGWRSEVGGRLHAGAGRLQRVDGFPVDRADIAFDSIELLPFVADHR